MYCKKGFVLAEYWNCVMAGRIINHDVLELRRYSVLTSIAMGILNDAYYCRFHSGFIIMHRLEDYFGVTSARSRLRQIGVTEGVTRASFSLSSSALWYSDLDQHVGCFDLG